jgi:hypothetical protein
LDIQNLYNYKSDAADKIVREVDANGAYLPASGDPLRYPLKKLSNDESGSILPTIGVIVEF